MKKLFATALFALLGAGAFAQTSEGGLVISGSIGLSGQGYETQLNNGQANNGKNTSFYISPSIGTFYRDGLEVGIRPSFRFYRNSNDYEGEERVSKEYRVYIGPYIRKYIPITEKLFFTADASVGASFGGKHSKATPAEDFTKTSKEFSFGISASPGLTYFATEKLGFSIDVGGVYLSRETTTNEQTDYKTISTSFGANVSPANSTIGILYIFNR